MFCVEAQQDFLSLNEFPLYSVSFVVAPCIALVTNTYEITVCRLCCAEGFMALCCV